MLRTVALCGLMLLAPTLFADEPASLKSARQRYLRGNYEEAAALYDRLSKEPKTIVPALIGLSRVHEAIGDYTAALGVLDRVAKPPVEIIARRAEVLFVIGKLTEALETADSAIKSDSESFQARWVKAQVLRDTGKLEAADEEMRWFVRTYTSRSNADNDITDPDQLLLVALAGIERARWYGLSDQFRFILNEVLPDALKSDKDFWPAEALAGLLLLEKYNKPEAISAFDKALKINPRAVDAILGKAMAAAQGYELQEAENLAEQALKVNPNHPGAKWLKADVLLMAGEVAAAEKLLQQAKSINPLSEDTLARLAACRYFVRDEAGFKSIVESVNKTNPKAAHFHFVLGERLEDRRYYQSALKEYQRAIELNPKLPGPRNALALLYMRMGQEKEAGPALDAAFKADRFNVRVANQRKVLKHLEGYKTIRTPHFEFRYLPSSDPVLGPFMAEYLEVCYADLAKQFRYEPPGPILFELFATHEMFSGRTIALPDLHTIGASTGRMIAMVTPNEKAKGKPVRKPFNWGRVVRHELVHVFNLEQTHFQCPHWLTEGLAVQNEGFARPPVWDIILRERFSKKELLNLDSINLGFIRPRSPAEWQLAYCQSLLYVQFLTKEFGQECIAGLLSAFAEGRDVGSVIQAVCRKDKAEVEAGYLQFVGQLVKSLPGTVSEKPLTYKQLQEAHEKDPEDLNIAARLAEQYLRRSQNASARRFAEAVLKKDPRNARAAIVKSQLLITAGDEAGAIKLLETAFDPDKPEPRLALALGKRYFESRDYPKATEMLEFGLKLEPNNIEFLEQLARVYFKSKANDKLIQILRQLLPLDPDDISIRKQLAKLLLDADKPAEAEPIARECLFIDISDEEGQSLLFDALESQKKTEELKKLKQILNPLAQ